MPYNKDLFAISLSTGNIPDFPSEWSLAIDQEHKKHWMILYRIFLTNPELLSIANRGLGVPVPGVV